MDDIPNGTITESPLPRLAASLDEVSEMLGIGKTLLRQLNASGEFGPQFHQFGLRRVASVDEIHCWLKHGCPSRGEWIAR